MGSAWSSSGFGFVEREHVQNPDVIEAMNLPAPSPGLPPSPRLPRTKSATLSPAGSGGEGRERGRFMERTVWSSRRGAERRRHSGHCDSLTGRFEPPAPHRKNPKLAVRMTLGDQVLAVRSECHA